MNISKDRLLKLFSFKRTDSKVAVETSNSTWTATTLSSPGITSSTNDVVCETSTIEEIFNKYVNDENDVLGMFLDITIRQTVLPNRSYLALALDLICKINSSSYDNETQKFAKFIAIFSIISDNNANCLNLFNQINLSKLRNEWKDDIIIWQDVIKNSYSKRTINDRYLKS